MVDFMILMRCVALICMVLGTQGVSGGQVSQMLRSPFPEGAARFGESVAVEGEWLAVASDGLAPNIGRGHVQMFRRDASDVWNVDVALRPLAFIPSSPFNTYVVGLRKGRLFLPNFGVAVWHFDGATWQPEPIFGQAEQLALGAIITPYTSMATDGDTVVCCIYGLFDARVFAWQRSPQGVWSRVLDLHASQFGGLGVNQNNPTGFGSSLYVDGDVMAVSQPLLARGGVPGVGRVHVFRRVQGTWTLEQTLDHPSVVPPSEAYFGASVTGKGDELFVGCSGDKLDGNHPVGSVYAYQYTAGLGWQLDSRINVTGATAQLVSGSALGHEMRYVPPTLVVGASGLRGPGGTPQAPAAGRGTLLAFERCGDLWNQRTLLTTPAAWGVWGVGWYRMVDFDGETVVGAHPQVGFPHPTAGFWMPEAGMAIAAAVPPAGPPGICNEIGRPVCTPATSGTPPCACGAPPEPGRGCPNSTGRGARLFCQGAFDQFTIERVLVEDLPPGAVTLVTVGAPTPTLLPGVAVGSGVSCVGAPLVQRVAIADAAGMLRIDELPAPPASVLYNAFLQPFSLQAFYRDSQDPCSSGWNATNGVAFSAGL